MKPIDLCLSLAKAEEESEVIDLLKHIGGSKSNPCYYIIDKVSGHSFARYRAGSNCFGLCFASVLFYEETKQD